MRRNEKERILFEALARASGKAPRTLPAPDPAAALVDDTHGLELYCAQLLRIFEEAPRFAAAGLNRTVVELDARLVSQMSQHLRYLLVLRRRDGMSPPISG